MKIPRRPRLAIDYIIIYIDYFKKLKTIEYNKKNFVHHPKMCLLARNRISQLDFFSIVKHDCAPKSITF